MDTSNAFLVRRRSCKATGKTRIDIHAFEEVALGVDEAVNLAAWLIATADPGCQRFDQLMARIQDVEVVP